VVDHVLYFGLLQFVVLETHDAVAHEDALDVDVLVPVVLVVLYYQVSDVRNVLPRVALARNLSGRGGTKRGRLANSEALLKMKSLMAVKASRAVS
jgi:hypothetical protein